MIRRIVLIASMAIGLAGCVTPETSAKIEVAANVGASMIPPTRADAIVARASAEVTQYCFQTKLLLAGVGFFASDKVKLAADYANVAVTTVCENPPTDLRTALATISRAFVAVQDAQRAGT